MVVVFEAKTIEFKIIYSIVKLLSLRFRIVRKRRSNVEFSFRGPFQLKEPGLRPDHYRDDFGFPIIQPGLFARKTKARPRALSCTVYFRRYVYRSVISILCRFKKSKPRKHAPGESDKSPI